DFSDLAAKWNTAGKKVILTVCRLDPRKNLITLVNAANIIVNQMHHKDFLFILVGDGVERPYLEENVQKLHLGDYVKFAGAVANTGDLLPKYYAMADLFVLPTLYEGFGWVFLEAMACKLPIITTTAGSN